MYFFLQCVPTNFASVYLCTTRLNRESKEKDLARKVESLERTWKKKREFGKDLGRKIERVWKGSRNKRKEYGKSLARKVKSLERAWEEQERVWKRARKKMREFGKYL